MRSSKRTKSWTTRSTWQPVFALHCSPAQWVHSGIEAADEECGRFRAQCCQIVESSQCRMAGVSTPGTACASESRPLHDQQEIPEAPATIVLPRDRRKAAEMRGHSEWLSVVCSGGQYDGELLPDPRFAGCTALLQLEIRWA